METDYVPLQAGQIRKWSNGDGQFFIVLGLRISYISKDRVADVLHLSDHYQTSYMNSFITTNSHLID